MTESIQHIRLFSGSSVKTYVLQASGPGVCSSECHEAYVAYLNEEARW